MDDIFKLKQEQFPKPLLEIPQPPKTLFIRGKLPDPELIYLAVVGSRKYTSYGRDICEKLIRGLAGYPIVIVSGLALGIDTIAHKTAITAIWAMKKPKRTVAPRPPIYAYLPWVMNCAMPRVARPGWWRYQAKIAVRYYWPAKPAPPICIRTKAATLPVAPGI